MKKDHFLIYTSLIVLSILLKSCVYYEHGYVMTYENKKIEGYMPMINTHGGDDYTIYFRKIFTIWPTDPGNKKTQTKIKIANIKYFKVKENNSKDTSLYIHCKNSFFKLLAGKGDMAIYQRLYSESILNGTDWGSDYLADVLLFSGGEQKMLMFTMAQPGIKNKADVSFRLLKFINKEYGQKFTKYDFKDEGLLFNYILDKEIKKNNRK